MSYIQLSTGRQGEEVKKLQKALSSAGYYISTAGVDGIYGSDTAAAVRSYQQANGPSVASRRQLVSETSAKIIDNTKKAKTNRAAKIHSVASYLASAKSAGYITTAQYKSLRTMLGV